VESSDPGIYRDKESQRLMVNVGKRDSRELVARFNSPSRLEAHGALLTILPTVPDGYRIEEEHILGMRDRNGHTLGRQCAVRIVIRHVDTVHTDTVTPEEWGSDLSERLE
jgi:hypothetical protein